MISKAQKDKFLDKSSEFTKYYVDYYLKLIRQHHILTAEENNMVLISNIKYYTIHSLGVLGFLVSLRKYYRASFGIDYYTNNIDYFKYLPYYAYGLGSLLAAYIVAEFVYCQDLKYLVVKYSQVDKKQYLDSRLNKKILESYYKENSLE
jgi:hypothetical protein